ncbi:hypothetical protein D3C81_991510 [compost metagenome]
MLSSAPAASARLAGVSALVPSLLATTSATPAMPSSRPSHWRPLMRSPNRAAISAVRIGCMPAISADTPAGMPSLIAAHTPPR